MVDGALVALAIIVFAVFSSGWRWKHSEDECADLSPWKSQAPSVMHFADFFGGSRFRRTFFVLLEVPVAEAERPLLTDDLPEPIVRAIRLASAFSASSSMSYAVLRSTSRLLIIIVLVELNSRGRSRRMQTKTS